MALLFLLPFPCNAAVHELHFYVLSNGFHTGIGLATRDVRGRLKDVAADDLMWRTRPHGREAQMFRRPADAF